MDSTVMRSPPTSRAIAARSSVVVMTLGFPCACAIDAMSVIANAAAHVDCMNFMTTPQVLDLLQNGCAPWAPMEYWNWKRNSFAGSPVAYFVRRYWPRTWLNSLGQYVNMSDPPES